MVIVQMTFMTMEERKRFFREAGRRQDIALYTKPLRVKVYARVSTEHESHVNALENQIEWYKTKIADNWVFNPETDMYVDRGITGTQVKERAGFLSLIEEARKHPDSFDIIITREVSRFARNVEETFRYTRELRELGIGVLFLSDVIWSFDDSSDGLVKLSVMASLAQGESKKVSERSLAGQEISRRNGQPYGNGNILGYDKVHHNKNKDIDPRTNQPYRTTFTYEINEEQAETVRRIYELSNQGYGSKRICNILKQENRKTAMGGMSWDCSTVNRILSNPTYMGYNSYGQSKVIDYLTHEKVYEHDVDKLELVKGDWEPIISEEEWRLAQTIRMKRKRVIITDELESKYGAVNAKNIWIRKLQCQCGSGFRRDKWRNNKLSSETIYGYTCYNQVNNGSRSYNEKRNVLFENACDVQRVQECKLELMAKKIFEIVWKNQRQSMKLAIEMIAECYVDKSNDNSAKIEQVECKLKEEESSKVRAGMLAAKGLIDEDTLKAMMLDIDENIRGYRSVLANLKAEKPRGISKKDALKNIEDAFNEIIDFTKPVIDSQIVDRFIHKILVCENSEYIWVLDFNIENNMKPIIRVSPNSREHKTRLKVFEDYSVFLEFEISFDECSEYMKSRGRRIVKRGWDTLRVKVALVNY